MTSKTRGWITALALGLCIGLPSVAEATNGYRPIGYGPKSKGMGGVGVALPQDAFASALNPAGIAFVCDRFDLGIEYLRHRADLSLRTGTYSDPTPEPALTNNYRSDRDIWWPEAAFTWTHCPCCALGVAVYAFGGWDIDYGQRTFLGGTSGDTASVVFEGTELSMDYQVYFVTPSYACTICQDHTFGVSANIAVGALTVGGMESVQSESLFPQYVSNKGADYQSGLGFQIGWIGQFPCDITLGATYKSRTYMNHFKKYRGFIPEDGNIDLPSIWGFGATWCICGGLVASADFERIQWTDTKLFRHDFFNTGRFGSKSGRGLGWEDQSVVKLGFAWDTSDCLTLRAGFNYGTTLFANRDLLFNSLDVETIKHHFTIGATYYGACFELTANYIWGYRHVLGASNDQFGAHMKGSQNSFGINVGYRY